MPRFDDRFSSTRLYVGHLSSRTRTRDLEDLFSRYGRVRDVDMKRDYAFVEFSDPRDADDARYALDGRDFDGSRIIVEFARGTPRGPGGSRDFGGRAPPPGSGRCFNCGLDGHWARDCKAGDWKNKCYRCGERGHIERNCRNSPKKVSKRGRSYSRSPSPRRGGRSPRRSVSRSRSYSRSPLPKRQRVDDDSRSPRRSRSPKRARGSPVSSRGRKRSPSIDGRSPPVSRGRKRSPFIDDRSPPVSRGRKRSPSFDDRSPPISRGRNRSPSIDDRSPLRGRRDSPPVSRGRNRSPSIDDRSPLRGRRDSLSPPRDDDRRVDNGSDYADSPPPRPRSRSASPMDDRADRGESFGRERDRGSRSPLEANGGASNGDGRTPSPAPRHARDDEEDDYRASPRGSE